MEDEQLHHEHPLVRSAGPQETKRIASLLARRLQPGDIILLTGDLGAGKTHFVQGIAVALGCAAVPVSPTFNIVLTYDDGRLPLHHFDLYRLDDAEQLQDIGLREYLEDGGVSFVEWAEKFPDAFDEYLAIQISKLDETQRAFSAIPVGPRAEELLALWKTDLSEPGLLSTEGIEPTALASDCEIRDCLRNVSRISCPAESALGFMPSAGADASPGARFCSPKMPAERGAAARIKRCGSPPAEAFWCEAKREGDSSAAVGCMPFVGTGKLVLAFDTANEVVAIGVGALVEADKRVVPLATREIAAHRASNTTLVPAIDAMFAQLGLERRDIACVAVGRGPGSFTGVRIAVATAKGIAQALGVGLVGVSTLDAIAWNAQAQGVRGELLVVADAMRKEVYPVRYSLEPERVSRQGSDYVVKAERFCEQLPRSGELQIIGDGLVKYRELFEPAGMILSDKLWEVTGAGLLLALQDQWRAGAADPLDADAHDPAAVLPVYTRLSDAEENERARASSPAARNLKTGVQTLDAPDTSSRATMHNASAQAGGGDFADVVYRPLKEADCEQVAALEAQVMGEDAWSARLVCDELGQRDRTWWAAQQGGRLIGYAGGFVVDGDLQILKVAVAPEFRRAGIARQLLGYIAEDARNLGAATCSLEVRAGNTGAQELYRACGLQSQGTRPRYYGDREDAVIMAGALPVLRSDVAGMALIHHGTDGASGDACAAPLILAIESSCDETAAAVIDGAGDLLADVIASQIDFHARFGGVVPEIASRKHIEAICGVCEEALVCASGAPAGRVAVRDAFAQLSAIAVTYAPGLLGGLVVGVAYAKGAAWALDIPLIGVNHLEGHLYANKLADPDFAPPAIVSLVSGGNTLLVHMRDWGSYETLGYTIDDAVGEAFDKVSKALGLGYPGGPIISKLAQQGDPRAIAFPRAMMHSHDLRFSLSGLKTAVVNYLQEERQAGRELNLPDIAASFQQAVIDVQVAKAKTALEQTGAPLFCLGGGVAANPALRDAYARMCDKLGVRLVVPPIYSCGDNAGMIALVALDRYAQGLFWSLASDAQAHADLDEKY